MPFVGRRSKFKLAEKGISELEPLAPSETRTSLPNFQIAPAAADNRRSALGDQGMRRHRKALCSRFQPSPWKRCTGRWLFTRLARRKSTHPCKRGNGNLRDLGDEANCA